MLIPINERIQQVAAELQSICEQVSYGYESHEEDAEAKAKELLALLASKKAGDLLA